MSETSTPRTYTAFRRGRRVAAGSITQVALKVKELATGAHAHGVLIFDDATSQQIDLDLTGTPNQILKRIESSYNVESLDTAELKSSEKAARPGRPRLGVVAKEVTLLPRHWEWLSQQPGGASVALRKLVEEARRVSSDRDTIRQAQDATYKFMSAMAGNEQGFEEATRALFRKSETKFDESTKTWPEDIRKHAKKLAFLALQNARK